MKESECDQAVGDNVCRRAVYVAPFDAWLASLGRGGESLSNDGVEFRLLARERAGDGICPRDVAGVAALLAARVDEHEFAGRERPRSRSEVEDCRVAPAGHDRVECEKVGTAAEELGFQVYLDLTLRLPPPGDEVPDRPERVRRKPGAG